MRKIKLTETRKSGNWHDVFMVQQKRNGRDNIVDGQFLVVEVSKDADEEKALSEALNKLSEIRYGR